MMRRRPLLRAAAVGGGAYYLGRRRREAQRGDPDDAIQRLERLGRLREQGVLTDEELADQKAQILGVYRVA